MTPLACRNAIASAISAAVARITGMLGGASIVGFVRNHPLSTASCGPHSVQGSFDPIQSVSQSSTPFRAT